LESGPQLAPRRGSEQMSQAPGPLLRCMDLDAPGAAAALPPKQERHGIARNLVKLWRPPLV